MFVVCSVIMMLMMMLMKMLITMVMMMGMMLAGQCQGKPLPPGRTADFCGQHSSGIENRNSGGDVVRQCFHTRTGAC